MFNQFKSYTFFPAQPWSHAWERQHELIYRFAQEIKNTIYIFPPLGMVNYKVISDEFVWKALNKFKRINSSRNQNSKLGNMDFIKSPYIHKFNKISTKINCALLNRKVDFSSNSNFFWSTYINPTVYEFFKQSSFRIIDLAERRQANPHISKDIKSLEKKAVSEAELVIVDNLATYEDYKGLSDRIVYIPQGYDAHNIKFEQQQRLAKKIGYIGHLHSHIDYDYLYSLIELNKDKEFLIVGGILDDRAKRLYEYTNVELTGQVPKDMLPKYLKQMKFGLIPYQVNEFTNGVFPTKLFEYLGAGVPVISTPIPEVLQYENRNNVLIEQFPRVIDYQVSLHGLEDFLTNNTWDARFDEYLQSIERALK